MGLETDFLLVLCVGSSNELKEACTMFTLPVFLKESWMTSRQFSGAICSTDRLSMLAADSLRSSGLKSIM